MLDKEEKNAALIDKEKRMWVQKCFRSTISEGRYRTLYKELTDDEMKFYQYFRKSKHQFNYLLQKIIFAIGTFIIFCEIQARPK
jgi:nucleoid-associated protein YejK